MFLGDSWEGENYENSVTDHFDDDYDGCDSEGKFSSSKDTRPKTCLSRRNTLDTIIFNKMCDRADLDRDNENREEAAKDGGRKCKRILKLMRGSERDLKLDVEAASHYASEKSLEKRPATTPNNMKIETRNRFRCLSSKLVGIGDRKNETTEIATLGISNEVDKLNESPRSLNIKDREIFHDTFSFLIRLGGNEKDRNCRRQMSSEETRWQNELKDLIWLELQAYHADRSPVAQDSYLCKQREAVGALLTEIMEYKYDPTTSLVDRNLYSSISHDSGFDTTPSPGIEILCPGCLSMHCRACARSQLCAMKQVENLLSRLEAAEALYPSSQAFANYYPMYKSSEFTDRVKAMCLWYNMTKHHRLKLMILGKLLMMLDTTKSHYDHSDSGISSRASDSNDVQDARCSAVTFQLMDMDQAQSTTPTDSNNSNASSGGGFTYSHSPSTPESLFAYPEDDRLDFYLLKFDRQAYRKYIEDVLKTRGLGKSLNFLERLHTSVLRKARLALEKCDRAEDDTSASEEYEGDRELRRYGAWSPEARALNLPSYRSAFVFLSRVPLEVVHEFLRMRLEQKPEQPGALSVRQLMREMREGLRIACIHRDRFEAHSRTALACDTISEDSQSIENIEGFDNSLKSVCEVYLDYLHQWVEMVEYNSFHKNLIDDEWTFVKSIAGNIAGGYRIGSIKFCEIACAMIEQVQDFLLTRPQEICESTEVKEEDGTSTRFHLMYVSREWQGMFVEAREKVVKCVCLAKSLRRDIETFPLEQNEIDEAISSLTKSILSLGSRIRDLIEKFQATVDQADEPRNECDRAALKTRIREILHQAYRMGFDYYKIACKFFVPEERGLLIKGLVSFATLWMEFVKTKCERGRGLRPRWANHGLEYLMIVCEPLNTKHLSDKEFEELKASMDRCISHVVGTATTPNSSMDLEGTKRLPKSRVVSPSRHARGSNFSVTPKSREASKAQESPLTQTKSRSPSVVDGNNVATLMVPEKNSGFFKREKFAVAVQKLDLEIDDKRREHELIGRVIDRSDVDTIRIKVRRVTFTWQRGIKVGQGRFGKVYTVVNNQTGELLAMKEVQLQPGDHRAIRRVAEELQIFEGIKDKHLVRYYGMEIHREEMLIFMEFCAEGTLESLVAGSENGLPELCYRKYTNQLLSAVAVLHSHGIVHRDIKSANIFLTDQGNCLKLGDFGSAVQIRAHTTMPGELQGFVGTQAYMAPEVFMKTESGGHGRAADIWSVGCCVIEMASGRRPWAEFDSNYQIMFKVGMGESPAPPKNFSQEGLDFIEKCLQHDPRRRPTANSLLPHPFAKIYEDVNSDLLRGLII
ncbi:mitogen-activated protein kinase kinase kinase 4 isoform X2 [Venturia canescens]|uniref:mitogen-activated protein kinase kinase kinase 4 isoform X2 n=1 Tax=Venturia canescens TaxID=32260 RepID=UPI001C9C4CA8|nr:mitogen-activated protein kinase kinase kinase 4 isoform X2 [Venturia canescens]